MKKVGITFFILCLLLCLSISANAAGLLSPAISVMQEDTVMIKTGVGTNTVSFDAEDFAELLGDEDFLAIEITELPEVSDGVLKLGAVDVTPGQLISYDALAALRFVPAEEGAVASFQFKPYGDRYENSFECTVCMLDALNFAPTAVAAELDAKEAIPVYASLSAEDPEGDAVTYRIVEKPKKGTLKLTDKKTGAYCYTADEGSHGRDSFTYVAVDSYGNQSEPATVSITTTENKTGIVYTDLIGSEYQLPAVAMAEMGVIVGEQIGEEQYFYPDKTVSRADFLIMAMNAMGIDPSLFAADESGFADSAEFTEYQNEYISAAQGLGIVVGVDTEQGRCFLPNETITSAQAATVISRIAALEGLSFGDAVYASVGTDDEISDDGYAMLASVGLAASEDRDAALTRADAVSLLYTLTCMQ